MTYQLNLREVTYALSEALDYVGVDDTKHGKRVAYMAAEIARILQWSQSDIDDILMAGMLHDSGVSSTDVHSHLINELDWEDSEIHCQRGYSLLKKVRIFHQYAPVVLYHHTHWNLLAPGIDPDVKYKANLLFLADRIDALKGQFKSDPIHQKSHIYDTIEEFSGTMFAPELVNAFQRASASDSFWFYLEDESLQGYFDEWIALGEDVTFPFDSLKEIAMMFAKVVDAKSTFTSVHTFGVASLARYLSELYGLPLTSQEKVELSAYFHDLGKLRVADSILHKNGPLNEEEQIQMNRHGFDSHVILRKIRGFHEIAKIASYHHETLDAQGYPYHLKAEQIPIEARILAIADIFQALVQNRPYRVGLSALQAYAILDDMGKANKIDTSVIALVSDHLDECYERAVKPDPFLSENG